MGAQKWTVNGPASAAATLDTMPRFAPAIALCTAGPAKTHIAPAAVVAPAFIMISFTASSLIADGAGDDYKEE